jgi:phosphopantothenoylcysteine decarboxylase / phosphopantothenate---cysteine ligase
MHEAVMARGQAADAVIMAAAVADYAPDRIEARKITKQPGPLTLTLRRTPDILAELGERRQAAGTSRPILVGFAAETSELISRARAKRERKHLDVIVANDVSREGVGFEADTNAVTLITAEGEEEIGLRPKTQVAAAILDRLERLLEPRP